MNIILTGASRGIGYELTKELSKLNNSNLFIVSRNSEKLNQLKKECLAINSAINITALAFDLALIDAIPRLVSTITDKVEHIDILINNAGYLVNKPVQQTAPFDFEKVYKINVMAPFELIRCLTPALQNSAAAHVVNISSMGGFQSSAKFPGLAAYSSSKAAIASLTECLAEEFKESNIKFNCLALGAVATEMLEEAFPGYKAPTTAAQMATFIANFALTGYHTFNGKILPVSSTTP